jgi:putative spermidine/putrescine transport system permease protein
MAIYIYAPTLSLLVFSFNTGGVTAPFAGVTFEAYEALFANDGMWAAISRSIQLALIVTVITTLLATATALAYRYDFWGQRGMLYLIILGIITPGITYGVGTVLLLTQVFQLSRGLLLAVPVHVVWTLPFAVIVLLAGFPPNLRQNEQAAQVMGASKLTSFRKVILPQILPTVLGAAVFAFTLSYNEAERGLLLVGRETTMPIQVFSVASADRATPELFALGSVTTVFSTALLLLAGWLVIRSTTN